MSEFSSSPDSGEILPDSPDEQVSRFLSRMYKSTHSRDSERLAENIVAELHDRSPDKTNVSELKADLFSYDQETFDEFVSQDSVLKRIYELLITTRPHDGGFTVERHALLELFDLRAGMVSAGKTHLEGKALVKSDKDWNGLIDQLFPPTES